jgi:hypothetical protein
MNVTDRRLYGVTREKLPCETHLAAEAVARYQSSSSSPGAVVFEWTCSCGFDVDYRDTIGWWRKKWRRAMVLNNERKQLQPQYHPSSRHHHTTNLLDMEDNDEIRIAIHIRRGDYIDLRDDRLLPDTYYTNAVEHILRALSRILPSSTPLPKSSCEDTRNEFMHDLSDPDPFVGTPRIPVIPSPSLLSSSTLLPSRIRVQIFSEAGRFGGAVDHNGVPTNWPARINHLASKIGYNQSLLMPSFRLHCLMDFVPLQQIGKSCDM